LIEGINPLDQQGKMLLVNPLAGQRRAHSSKFRFARTDVWVRDIDQVIDDAARLLNESTSRLTDKVALVGYSLGGQNVGRTLYADNPNEQLLYADDNLSDDNLNEDLHNREEVIEKVSRVVFLNSLFFARGPTEEPDPFPDRPTFPLHVHDQLSPVIGSDAFWQIPPNATDTDNACTGRIILRTKDQVWTQIKENETVGREWGPTDPNTNKPTGLNRAPTFSGYGWNGDVAGQMSIPTLVMQGLLDGVLPTGTGTGRAIYNALPPTTSTFKKVLVEVKCASHALPWEGCSGDRCKPTGTTPYGGTNAAGNWPGPHSTLKAALIEWIKNGKFNNNYDGTFTVNESGIVETLTI
jgi:pimeloyl-ACP methyl ester carboxylesterase